MSWKMKNVSVVGVTPRHVSVNAVITKKKLLIPIGLIVCGVINERHMSSLRMRSVRLRMGKLLVYK